MQATLDDVAGRLYLIGDGLQVRRLSIQRQVGLERIIAQIDPGEDIPRPDGEFQIIIDVAPVIVRREVEIRTPID